MLPVKGTLLCAWSIYAVVYPIITTHIFIYIYIYLFIYVYVYPITLIVEPLQ